MKQKKTLNDLLLLGDPRLYERCEPIRQEELPMVKEWVDYFKYDKNSTTKSQKEISVGLKGMKGATKF